MALVASSSHMRGFIAGAATIGPVNASVVAVRTLAASPWAIRDIVVAESGAMQQELGDGRGVEVREHVVAAVRQYRPARERGEGGRADEPARVGGLHDLHVVAVLDEQPDELAALVRRDAAAHPHQDHDS